MYKRGLKEAVKDELMRFAGTTDTLNSLIEASIELDDKLYERLFDRRRSGKPLGRAGSWPGGKTGGSRRTTSAYASRQRMANDYGDPMEIDSVEPKRKKFVRNKKEGVKGKCYSCGKEGHFARNCRSKGDNTVQRRQFNAVIKKDNPEESQDDSDPWEEVDFADAESAEEVEDGDVWQHDSSTETSEVVEEELVDLLHQWKPGFGDTYTLHGGVVGKESLEKYMEEAWMDKDHPDHRWLPSCSWLHCHYHPQKDRITVLNGKSITAIQYFTYWENLSRDDSSLEHGSQIEPEECEVRPCRWFPHRKHYLEGREKEQHRRMWAEIHDNKDHENHELYTAPYRCNDPECTVYRHYAYKEKKQSAEERGLDWEHPDHHDHGTMAWSSCIYNTCEIHASSKLDNNYYPRPSSGKGKGRARRV